MCACYAHCLRGSSPVKPGYTFLEKMRFFLFHAVNRNRKGTLSAGEQGVLEAHPNLGRHLWWVTCNRVRSIKSLARLRWLCDIIMEEKQTNKHSRPSAVISCDQ